MYFSISIFHISNLPLQQNFLRPLVNIFLSLRQDAKGEVPGERLEGRREIKGVRVLAEVTLLKN